MPLLDQSAELVSGDVQTVEVGVQIEVLDLLNLKSDLSPGELLLLVGIKSEIGLVDLENATLKRISGDF